MDIIINMEQGEDVRGGRIATVERTLEPARRCAKAAAGSDSPIAPGTVSSELAGHLLPHLESDLRLAGAVPGSRGKSLGGELASQRVELGRLVEELDRDLEYAVHRPRQTGPRRRATQTLEAIVRLLEHHLVTEHELWAALDSAGTSEETLSTLSREAEATERRAERSLRFVWHPPVEPTEAQSLWWTSPKTRRVVVLDAAGVSGVHDTSMAGPAGKEAT